jgi:CBS domain-containing protein
MEVEDVMSRDVKTCRPGDTLESAARAMWEYELGCLPVLDDHGRLAGMLTDRDICMTACVHDAGLSELTVEAALREDPVSGEVWSCGPDDSLRAAAATMREYKVHRLPVVDREGRLVGLVSLSDLARAAAEASDDPARAPITGRELAETLRATCEPDPAGDV